MSKRKREQDVSDTTGNGKEPAKKAKFVKVKAKTIMQLKLLLRDLFDALFVSFDANGRNTRGMPAHHCIYVEDGTKNRPTVFSKILEFCDTTKASQLSRCFQLTGKLEAKHLATSAKKTLSFNVTRSSRTVGNNVRDNTLTGVRFRPRRSSGSHSNLNGLGYFGNKEQDKIKSFFAEFRSKDTVNAFCIALIAANVTCSADVMTRLPPIRTSSSSSSSCASASTCSDSYSPSFCGPQFANAVCASDCCFGV